MKYGVVLRCGAHARLSPSLSLAGWSFFGCIVHRQGGGRILEDLEPALWTEHGFFREDHATHDYDIPREALSQIWKAEKLQKP